MLLLAACLGAVLAVARDVEHGAEPFLEVERLRDELLGASEVLAGGDDREGLLAGEECVLGVSGGSHGVLRRWIRILGAMTVAGRAA